MMQTAKVSSQSKTQKVKKQLNQKEKDRLWAIYDADKEESTSDALDTMEQTEFCIIPRPLPVLPHRPATIQQDDKITVELAKNKQTYIYL